MKKSTLVRVQQQYNELVNIAQSTEDKLVEIIQSSISALATANPEMAIEVIEQIAKQKKAIKKMSEERSAAREEYVTVMTSQLPDSLEFDEEDSQEEDD